MTEAAISVEGYQAQPQYRRWTPSKRRFPWFGDRLAGGRFTAEQVQAMVLRGIAPEAPDTICVRRQIPDEDAWTPIGHEPGEYRFHCPVIGPGKGKASGKVLVIAPSGEPTHVWPDGWAHRPRKPRGATWYR